jgi:protocatechuate 3,4-dioxygenase alpha subunit
VSVFARGLLGRVVTRIYFPEDAAVTGPGGHADDPVLAAVPEHRRPTLIAQAVGGGYRCDIRLQGESETVFFDV